MSFRLSVKCVFLVLFLITSSCKKKQVDKPKKQNETSLSEPISKNRLQIKHTSKGVFLLEGERKLNWSLNKVRSIRNLSLNNLTKVKTSVSFSNYFLDFLRIGDFYYVLTTDVHTMKRDTYDYLSKYDDKFNLIWEKRLNVKKSALQKSFLHVLKDEKSIFYISNEWKPKTNKRDVVVCKYDLDGVLKTKSKYNQKGYSDINASLCLNKNSFLVVNDISSDSNRRMKSWVAKFNSDTKTVWKKEFDSIHVKK